MRITDDLGDTLTIDKPPERIVSLVPSITETIVELGAGERLIGITTYCIHPAQGVAGITKVGGTKGFSIDKIDSLRPDLVIANKEENKKLQIETLRSKYPVFVTYPRTVDQAMKMVIDLGMLTGTSTAATEIAETCDHIITSTYPVTLGAPLRTVCMIWRDPWMAVGADNYVSDLLETFGFENVFLPDAGRYPETTLDAVCERQPDVIFLPDEPFEFGEPDKKDIETALAQAHQTAAIVFADGSHLTWFGYRTIQGLRFLQSIKANLLSDNQ